MIPCVRVKDGVTFNMGPPAGFRLLGAIERLAFYLGHDVTISCGSEDHPPSDPHSEGEAFDISVRTFDAVTVKSLLLWLKNDLGPLFTVLYEVPTALEASSVLSGLETVNPQATGNHVHAQRRKGTVYPPQT
jgi:hypothetical protein